MDRNSNGDSTCKKRMNSLFVSPSAPSPAVCPILCLSVHNVDRFFSLCPVVVVVCFPVKICLKKASSNKKIVMLKRRNFLLINSRWQKFNVFSLFRRPHGASVIKHFVWTWSTSVRWQNVGPPVDIVVILPLDIFASIGR